MRGITEWLENAPDSWTTVDSQYVLNRVRRDPLPEDGIVTAFRDGEVTLRSNRRTEGFTNAEKEIGYQHIEAGDLVVHSMDGGFGAIGVADSSGKASPVVHAYRSNVCDLDFLAYQLRSAVDAGWIAAQSKGIRVRSTQFDPRAFAQFRVAFPPLDEQSRIADFLDEETGEIDRVVGVLDELIEDLDVRRSNTIREKMDEARELTLESGIATIPDLGYEAVLIRRGISPAYLEDGDEESESSIRVVNQKCIRSGSRIDYSLARRNDLSKKAVNDDLLIRPGDILINSTGTGTLGRTALVREVDEPTTFDSHVTLVRPKSSVDGGFLGYFMLNSEDILVLESRGSTNQIELSQNTVSWLELPLPSLDEQRRIADYLDEETSRIDKMKATATELRGELLARRKALITEYVTGQKRVE